MLKEASYGNGTGIALSYNSRGLMTQYSLTGVKETNGQSRSEGSDFLYYADTRIKFASDFYERTSQSISNHDHAYRYDASGRLLKAFSAVNANDLLNGTQSNNYGGAYQQTYSFDAWGNLLERTGSFWGEDDNTPSQTYDLHSRNTSWTYDASGNLLCLNESAPNELTFVPAKHLYDVSGQQVTQSQTVSKLSPTNPNIVFTTTTSSEASYDGDGMQLKRSLTMQVNTNQATVDATFFLRSTVLGGLVIADYNSQGTRLNSYVYLGRNLLFQQRSGQNTWHASNPVTGSARDTDSQGKLVADSYLDPEGVNTGAAAQPSGDTQPAPIPHAGAYAAFLPHSLGGTGLCSQDGAETGCAFAYSQLESGAAEQCPDNDCSRHYNSTTVIITYKNGSKKVITGFTDVPGGIFTFTGDEARGAAQGWNYAWVLTDDFSLLVKASIGGALLSRHGLGEIDSGRSFAESQNPLDPLTRAEISVIIDSIYKMFEEHPGCEEWTNKLLNELSDSTGYHAGSIRDILEDFRKNGTMEVYQSPNQSSAPGPGDIVISSTTYATGNPSMIMGEIIHSAGWPSRFPDGIGPHPWIYYTDVAMANAAAKLGVVMSIDQYRKTYPEWVQFDMKKYDRDFTANKLAHGAIDIQCMGAKLAITPSDAKL
jgi:hypothetical protein